jgi:hypothetical protein
LLLTAHHLKREGKEEMSQRLTKQAEVSDLHARPLSSQDALALGTLLYEPYHGTIDDEGGTPAEARNVIEDTLAGYYGPVLTRGSFLIEEQGRIQSASPVTSWTDEQSGRKLPPLAFLLTHPDRDKV